ncbi:CvpA family protein [Bacillus andreraoultii]|uniref:CvpA family protein n=1 Tax=Bacillus andreraoultii TaxID=1499685 RepID=UPI00053B7F0D|nr:CvpA family protein [Bacillus andreraoultii]
MLSLILLFFLFIGFIVGLKRGFILQVIHLTSFFIAFIIAMMYYKDLALRLTLWIPYPTIGDSETLKLLLGAMNAEEAFYRGISFFLIFIAVKIVLQIIGSMLDFVANIPIIKQLNIWAGGILGFLEVYLIIFLILYIIALFPINNVQTWIDQSAVAKGIIQHTPILSKQIYNMWF